MTVSKFKKVICLLLVLGFLAPLAVGCDKVGGGADKGAASLPKGGAEGTITAEAPVAESGGLALDATNAGLAGDAAYTIEPAAGLPKLGGEIEVTAYEFSLEGITQVEGVLALTIPYDKEELGAKAATGNVCAAYFNEATQDWEPVSYDIDEAAGTVTIYTDHLSVYGCFVVNDEYTRSAFAAYSMPSLALSGSGDTRHIEALREAASSMDQPGEAASDMGWAVLETAFALGETGFEIRGALAGSAFLAAQADKLGKACALLGIAVSSLQCISNLYQGRILEGYESLFEVLLGAGTYMLGAAVSSIPMLFVLAAKYGIKMFANAALSGRKDIYAEAYRLYYESGGVKRTAADWCNLFMKAEATASSPDRFELRVDGLVRRYVEQFWEDELVVAAYQAEAQRIGATGGGGLNESIKAELSESYRIELYKGVLQDAFAMMMQRKKLIAEQEVAKQLDEARKVLNEKYVVEFYDGAAEKANAPSRYAGYTVYMTNLPDEVKDKASWSAPLDDSGRGSFNFTLLGYMMAGMPVEFGLFPPGTSPETDAPEFAMALTLTGPTTRVDINGVPTLADLVGYYADGSITFETVHISQAILDAAQRKADGAQEEADASDDPFSQIGAAAMGCDIEMLRALQAYEGQTMPNPFTITAESETSGVLQFQGSGDDVSIEEGLTFRYDPSNGTLTFQAQQDAIFRNDLRAAYLRADAVGISGTLRVSELSGKEEDFYIDLAISGTKPLDGEP